MSKKHASIIEQMHKKIDDVEQRLDELKGEVKKTQIEYSFKSNFSRVPSDLITIIMRHDVPTATMRGYLYLYSLAYGLKPYEENPPTGITPFVNKNMISKATGITLNNIQAVMDGLFENEMIEEFERFPLKGGGRSVRKIRYVVHVPIISNGNIEWVHPSKAWYMESKEVQTDDVKRQETNTIKPKRSAFDDIFGHTLLHILDRVNTTTREKNGPNLNLGQIKTVISEMAGSEDNLRTYLDLMKIRTYDEFISAVAARCMKKYANSPV
ncbi:MAG TPA: hypothetical protein P5539_14270 [Mesotoga sp.]|nr:hypothetical protein [Mesotoga sp.]